MKKLALHWKIIIGLGLGIIWALISSSLGWNKFTLDWINPFGTIFINLLKLIAVPLVMFSIIKGITGLSDITKIGQIGTKTLAMYLVTTVMAVTLGLTIVNVIQPGTLTSEDQRATNRISYEIWKEVTGAKKLDDINFLSDSKYASKIAAARENYRAGQNDKFAKDKIKVAKANKESSPLQFIVDMVPSNIFLSLTNNSLMLQVIVFAIFFGITCMLIPSEKAKPILDFVEGADAIFLKMVDIVMQGAPFFVFTLLAGKLSEMAGNNPVEVIEIFKALGWYSITVFLGLVLMAFLIYPLIIKVFVKGMGFKDFFQGISKAQLLAFSTSSSVATLPVTMECVEDNLGVSQEVTSFVLPIGATVNMDGTSLYQAIAVVFLAQFHMLDLSISQQAIIILTATLASIGAAAVPSAGLIMLIIVLESVGLNPAWIAIIFPVDRILDMCRTVVNVTGDATVSTIIASVSGQLNKEKKE